MTYTADQLFPQRRPVALAFYVSVEDAYLVLNAQVRRDPVPFSNWAWQDLPRGAPDQAGISWWWRARRWRRRVAAGSILVFIGPTRSGKTRLLSRLTANGVLTLDETPTLGRASVLKTITALTRVGQGCAMAFQSVEEFCDMSIAAYLAQRQVKFVQFPARPLIDSQ